jgi:hypothetical protein
MTWIAQLARRPTVKRHVRCQHRHLRSLDRVDERIDPPIEFVITHHPGVELQMIEQVDHQTAARPKPDIGALVNISGIDQNRVRIFPAPPANLGHASGEPAHIRDAFVIQGRQNVTMQISGVENRYGDDIGTESRCGGRARKLAFRVTMLRPLKSCALPLPVGALDH